MRANIAKDDVLTLYPETDEEEQFLQRLFLTVKDGGTVTCEGSGAGGVMEFDEPSP